MAIKSREWLIFSATGKAEAWNGSNPAGSQTYSWKSYGRQKTDSTSHQYLRKWRGKFHRMGDPRYKLLEKADIGGSFLTQSWITQPGAIWVNVKTGTTGLRWLYNGPLTIRSGTQVPTDANFLTPQSGPQMVAFGSTGISRATPTNPLAGMGQFLGELREAPDLIRFESWKKMASRLRPKAAAKDYLNVVFGWQPVIRDVKKFLDVAAEEEKHIQQFERNSGRDVRRGSTVLDTSDTVITDMGTDYGFPALATQLYSNPGKLTRTVKTEHRVWFKGAFTYYLPPSNNLVGRIRRRLAIANAIYGLRLTPKLFYELTPWSWALDWRSNTGDIVNNWSNFANDGLVMRYGYVMSHKTVTTTYNLQNLRFVDGTVVNLTQTFIQETKQRIRATPWGFGLNPSSFTGKQWAIIAALGISKAPRSLVF